MVATKVPAPSQVDINNLLEHYQNGRYDDAEKSAISISQQFPNHQFGWKALGAIFQDTGRISEALVANQKAVGLDPKDAQAHSNLGNILQELGRLEDAEASYRKAIELKSDYAEAHYNLGVTVKNLGRLEEAEASWRQAIVLKPDFAEAHYNLGVTVKNLGRLEEAEASYKKAIALKPDDAEAYCNLGVTLQELGRLEEAEASCRQAIALKPNFAEAFSNLGNTLQELGRLEDAEASCRKAIELKSDYAEAHSNLSMMLKERGDLVTALEYSKKAIRLNPNLSESNLHMGIIFYANGDINSALESVEIANYIDPNSKKIKLVLAFLQAKNPTKETEVSVVNSSESKFGVKLNSYPLILKRKVEIELIANLYEMNFRQLDKTRDSRYGNGRCSPDFNMFEDERSIIKTVAEDLISIMRLAVKSEVFVYDSFFNILGSGGGSTPHCHLNRIDTDEILNFAKLKFSLVYYLSVGNQNCSEPGILKLYDPSEDILPCEGMIVIIPADRQHSAVYGGNKDRVMIGINFYSL